MACGGGVCLIAWRHAGTQVRAARVGPDGAVLDASPLVIPVDGPVATTSTTFDGEAFLVAWREETGAMRAAQVTPAGEIVAPGAFTINGPDPEAHRPVVASNDSAVAYYLSTVPARAAGPRRLSTTRPTGPLGSGAVSSGQVTQKVPSIAAGTYYLVACADVSSTVGELDEQNNCAASAGTTTIGPTLR